MTSTPTSPTGPRWRALVAGGATVAVVGLVVAAAAVWPGFDAQETPLQDFLPALGVLFAIHEFGSIFTFNSPFGGELWSIRSDYASGDLGWDPLGFKPSDPAELKEMQTKELNNGRLAMIGIVGMIGQELATGNKLF